MKILMVCHGNICRSPLADGLLRKKVKENNLQIMVDSAGTSNFHSGEAPDSRMVATARQFGVDISFLKARQIQRQDLNDFDVIYTMDRDNYWNVINLCNTKDQDEKVIPILDLIFPNENRSVPDPYYGEGQGFIDVFKMLDEATDKIIENFKRENDKR